MSSENVPTIPGQVEGGGPLFDMPHPEATDDPAQEEAQEAWFELLTSAVGN